MEIDPITWILIVISTYIYRYPIATMIGQSVGSMIVGLECILRFPPDIFFDTTGAAFIYPLVHLMIGSHVMAYVHYPTISTVS